MASSTLSIPITFWAQGLPRAPVSCALSCADYLVLGLQDGLLWILDCLPDPSGTGLSLSSRSILLGHNSPITALAAMEMDTDSRQQSIIVSASEDGEVKRWNLADGRCLQSNAKAFFGIPTHLGPIAGLDSKKGDKNTKFILCAGMANEACILDSTSLEVLRVWGGHTDWIFGNSLLSEEEGHFRNQLLSVSIDGKLVDWRFDESRLSVVKSDTHSVQLTQGDPIIKLVVSSLDSNGIIILGRKSAKYLSAKDDYQTTKASIMAPSGEAFILAEFVNDTTAIFQTNADRYYMCALDGERQEIEFSSSEGLSPRQEGTIQVPSRAVSYRGDKGHHCLLVQNTDSRLEVQIIRTPKTSMSKPETQDVVLFHPNESLPSSGITCSTMLDDTRIALGRVDGSIWVCRVEHAFIALGHGKVDSNADNIQKLEGHVNEVTCVFSTDELCERSYLFSGGSDGSVRIWNIESGAELACFRNHSSSVKFFVQMPEDVNSRLRKCMASIAEDYSISIISFEEMSCIYLFGSYQHRLLSIQWRPPEDYVVLCYADGAALVWQLQTGHLERIITGEAARELMEDTRWSQSRVVEERWLPSKKYIECSTDSIQGSGSTGIQTLLVNWRLLLTTLATIRVPEAILPPSAVTPRQPRSHGPPKRLDTLIGGIKNNHHRSMSEQPRAMPTSLDSGGQEPSSSASQALSLKAHNDLNAAKAILGLLITGDDPHSLSIRTLFGLGKYCNNVSLGMRGAHGNYSIIFTTMSGDHNEGWCISPTLTASRLIAIISLARSIAAALRIDVDLDTWTRGYCDALPGLVGSKFRAPSLSFLAKYWQDPQPDIQEATKIIMLSTLRNMTKVELQHTIKYWAGYLPAAASPENCSTQVMARSAIILGILGADSPQALSERTRQLVGLSLTLLLDDDSRLTYKMAAIELIAQGFATWQPYLRADAVLKTLFANAIDTTPNNKFISLRARKAAGQIASINPILFVSSLTQEIIDDKTIDDKIGHMKLISFFARKDPKVLYFGVQRLAEVIVKSLDPSSASIREALLPVGTSVLMDLVHGYPQIDFHAGSQKLGVGTLEGVIVVYDVQTATRWQILEGHTTPLSAVTFSKDGRTIVSCAIQEGTVKIWHANAGILGMLLGGGHGLWSATTVPTTTSASTMTTTTSTNMGGAAGSNVTSTRRPSEQVGGSSSVTHAQRNGAAGHHDAAVKSPSSGSALSSQKSNKTFDFALQDSNEHSIALDDPAVLISQVRFEWTSDRVVKLTVLDHIMSFNI